MFFYITNCLPDHNFPFSILHLIKTVFSNRERRLAVRASNERPYGIVRTITILRSGIICFFTLQTVFPTTIFHFQFSILHLIKTIYTNRERRLAVRASNERPYRFSVFIKVAVTRQSLPNNNYFAIFLTQTKTVGLLFFVNPTVNFLFGNLKSELILCRHERLRRQVYTQNRGEYRLQCRTHQ